MYVLITFAVFCLIFRSPNMTATTTTWLQKAAHNTTLAAECPWFVPSTITVATEGIWLTKINLFASEEKLVIALSVGALMQLVTFNWVE